MEKDVLRTEDARRGWFALKMSADIRRTTVGIASAACRQILVTIAALAPAPLFVKTEFAPAGKD